MAELIREAMFYEKLEGKRVVCQLCPQYCVLSDRATGICRARVNDGGTLVAKNYGQYLGLALDPIEKKPLYHYRPGSKILSLGANSCNLKCSFCQNYQISQFEAFTYSITPEKLYLELGKINLSEKQIAFTYTEPLTWYEFIYDFASIYRDVDVVLISNGFINEEPLKKLLPYVAAFNIDLKSFNDNFYQQQCKGRIEPVKNSIRLVYESGVHLEVTLLLIPGLNDDPNELDFLAKFLSSISDQIPLHISAYHPDYQLNVPATTEEGVQKAIDIAKRHLKYVYGGNLPKESLRTTYCPSCSRELITRSYFGVRSYVEAKASCPKCKDKIYGRFI